VTNKSECCGQAIAELAAAGMTESDILELMDLAILCSPECRPGVPEEQDSYLLKMTASEVLLLAELVQEKAEACGAIMRQELARRSVIAGMESDEHRKAAMKKARLFRFAKALDLERLKLEGVAGFEDRPTPRAYKSITKVAAYERDAAE
jgi:hypothetical protein